MTKSILLSYSRLISKLNLFRFSDCTTSLSFRQKKDMYSIVESGNKKKIHK